MKVIRFFTTYADAAGVTAGPGDERRVDDDKADTLVELGNAEYVDQGDAPRTRAKSGSRKPPPKPAPPKEADPTDPENPGGDA